jgi:hypothetical protein
MESLKLLLLGWLLGILGGPISDRIRRRYSAHDLRKACITELLELRYTMASCVHLFRSRLGTLDRDLLEWLEPIEAQYEGPDKDPRALTGLQELKAMSPETLAAAMAASRANLSALSLKQYSVSFLDSQLANLSILPFDLQQRLLQVKDQLSLFNQDVDFLNGQAALTFEGNLGGANYATVQQNLINGYEKLASRAKGIADAITSIRQLYS